MSNKYKEGDYIPSAVLAKRLDELACAVAEGKKGTDREFKIRIPAELDRCADLVMSAAAERIRELEKYLDESII